MILNRCKKCDSILWTSNDELFHKCHKFLVYDENEDDEYELFGTDMKSVIEKLAKEHNSDDPIVGSDLYKIPLKITDEIGNSKWFNVYPEPSIMYHVNEVSHYINKIKL